MKQFKSISIWLFAIISLNLLSLNNSIAQSESKESKLSEAELAKKKEAFFAKTKKYLLSSSFSCRESDPTNEIHKIDYPKAFNYIWNFVSYNRSQAKYGACAEIPLTKLIGIINYTDPGHIDHCGLLCYMRYISGRSPYFAIAYHESIINTDPRYSYPKGDDNPKFYKANCSYAFPNAETISPNALNSEITQRNSRWWSPPPVAVPTVSEEIDMNDINNNGALFTSILHVDQAPIGFFHAQELKELLQQNDPVSSPTSPYDHKLAADGIRIYFGYDPDAPVNPDNSQYKVKLVAFAIDQYGNNIIYKYDGSDAIILERSWPPDQIK
jgi:hypothetical protein